MNKKERKRKSARKEISEGRKKAWKQGKDRFRVNLRCNVGEWWKEMNEWRNDINGRKGGKWLNEMNEGWKGGKRKEGRKLINEWRNKTRTKEGRKEEKKEGNYWTKERMKEASKKGKGTVQTEIDDWKKGRKDMFRVNLRFNEGVVSRMGAYLAWWL